MQQCLRHEAHMGRNVALIIDEAEHLPLETLEQLWERACPACWGSCPSIVLVGQPALQQHLQAGTSTMWPRASASVPRSRP